MKYIDRELAQLALANMKNFHDDVVELYTHHDMDLLDNLGRRNIVMSQAQEKFFAQELSHHYEGVSNDGRTGQPDILIDSLDKELECKLTTRHKSGAISLQSDYETLCQKKNLDYLYVIANPEFDAFAVLHFIGLGPEHFSAPSPGSRGKVRMLKHRGMDKCQILFGAVHCLNDRMIDKWASRARAASTPGQRKLALDKIEKWKTQEKKFSFELEKISQESNI